MNFMVKSMALIMLVLGSAQVAAFTGDGTPFKYISSCEMDFNGDLKSDKAILLEGLGGQRELVVLIAKASGYEAHVVSTGRKHMYMSCLFENSITDVFSGDKYKTNGTVIELRKFEVSSVAYFWQGDTFKEVWTSD